nr:MAG TPA: hypothetical protein [Caudoviricetes sp.]DAW68622.1 MAG TPA: hypothetical protein [Caudoviricetes sp.]
MVGSMEFSTSKPPYIAFTNSSRTSKSNLTPLSMLSKCVWHEHFLP